MRSVFAKVRIGVSKFSTRLSSRKHATRYKTRARAPRTRVRVYSRACSAGRNSSVCKWIEDRRIASEKKERKKTKKKKKKKKTTKTGTTRSRSRSRSRNRSRETRRVVGWEWERKKRREARDLFARISTGGRSPWPLPRNAFRIRPLPRNMFCDGVEVSASIQAKPVTEVCYCFRGPRTRFLRYDAVSLARALALLATDPNVVSQLPPGSRGSPSFSSFFFFLFFLLPQAD